MISYNEEGEEARQLRDSVAEFAKKEIEPKAQELDKNETFSYDITEKMGKHGLFGMFVNEEFGGYALDYLSYIIAVEEVARVDSSQAATLAAGNSLGIGPIYYYGTEEQKKKYLPDLCAGKSLWAFALTEPNAGSDAQASQTSAVFDSSKDEWTINGSKIWITNSATDITKGLTVQAVTGKRADGRPELTTFLVPSGTKGLTCKPMKDKMVWRSSNTGEVFLDDVKIPSSNALGEVGQGFKIMMETLDGGRLSIAAMGLGLAKGALDLAVKYANERTSFSKPLVKHQVIAFKIADMGTQIAAAEAMLYKACWLRQNGKPFNKLAAMSKLFCSETAEFCARESQQIFGGYGLMKEFPVERHYRDAALLRIGEGTSEIQRIVISRMLGC